MKIILYLIQTLKLKKKLNLVIFKIVLYIKIRKYHNFLLKITLNLHNINNKIHNIINKFNNKMNNKINNKVNNKMNYNYNIHNNNK